MSNISPLKMRSMEKPVSSLPQSVHHFSFRAVFFRVSVIAFVVLALDLGSKWWVVQYLKHEAPVTVIPGFLRFIYAENPGIAFGLLTEHSGWLHYLTPVAFIVLLVILYQTFANGQIDRWMILTFGLIIGGALGNILDRMYHGFVVDFIDAYYKSYHWYTFNIADSALTVGEVLLIIKLLFMKEPASNPQTKPVSQPMDS